MIGIDTIVLKFKVPILRQDHNFVLVPLAQFKGKPKYDKYLEVQEREPGKEGDGDVIDAIWRNAYFRKDFVDIRGFSGNLMATFSVPQVFGLSADNVEPTSLAETEMVFDYLQEWLAEIAGADLKVREATISRLDLFANAVSRYPFEQYQPLFEILNLRRQFPHNCEGTMYGLSEYQTTCVYDKGVQMGKKEIKDHIVNHYSVDLGNSLIRWEIRLKRARSVERLLGIRTVGELLADWNRVRNFYISQVKKALRIEDDLNRYLPVPDLKAEISQLIEPGREMKALWLWLQVYGARAVAENFPDLIRIKEVLRDLGYESYQISRFLREVAKLRYTSLAGEQVSLNRLRQELFDGLIS